MRKWILIGLLVVFSACAAQASPWSVTIGDFDGFGFNGTDGPSTLNPTTGPWIPPDKDPIKRTTGAAADTDSDGVLKPGEYLPDINSDLRVRHLSADNWDNRKTGVGNEEYGGSDVGVVYVDAVSDGGGSTGAEFTDITLTSTYYDDGSPIAEPDRTSDNYLGAFPDGNPVEPNDAAFAFNFKVAKTLAHSTDPVILSLIHGDYDVEFVKMVVTGPSGQLPDIYLTTHTSADDGLIQETVASLSFFDVFTDGGSDWLASVTVDVVMEQSGDVPTWEPYIAYDAIQLSQVIPEPSTYALFGLGALGLLVWRRRRAA